MSATYVPMISSGVAGPLGVLHLPRLWLKASLEARGKLAAGYPGCGKGYDQMVIDGLGLNREAVLGYIRDQKPTYPQFESWIRQQPGVKLDKASVEKLNSAMAAMTPMRPPWNDMPPCHTRITASGSARRLSKP